MNTFCQLIIFKYRFDNRMCFVFGIIAAPGHRRAASPSTNRQGIAGIASAGAYRTGDRAKRQHRRAGAGGRRQNAKTSQYRGSFTESKRICPLGWHPD